MQSQELNLIDGSVFEEEVQFAISSASGNLTVFLADMSGIGKLFRREGGAVASTFLGTIAKLLARICRSGDNVYRIGQYTFALVLRSADSPVLQQLAAEKVVRLYKTAISEIDTAFKIDINIGIASYPEHADTAVALIRNASLALEAARSAEEPYIVYDLDLTSTMAFKWSIQDDLARAISEKQLDVVYQPKVSATTGRPVGAEALVRWNRGDDEFVPPSVFVPLACEIGLIGEMTNLVLRSALAHASEWPDIGSRCSVSVNIEAQTLRQPGFDDLITNSLSIWGSDNFDLIIEITELALVVDSKSNFQCLTALRSSGIGVSVDDFGTGYSSLSYFQKIPADELKIDRQFVSNMLDCAANRKLVETIVGLGHQFGLTVVAEGVENADQLRILSEIGCDLIQGYYVCEPLTHEEYCIWLEQFAAGPGAIPAMAAHS